MAKNVIINGVTYADVPYTKSPLADGSGDAKFVDTDSGNAAAGDMRAGKKAWVGGNEVTGTQPERSATDVAVSGKTVTVPAGIYDAQAQKSVADGSVTPAATVAGDEIGDTVSDYPVAVTPSATVTAGYVSGNKTGAVVTKYIQAEEKSATPSVAAQTITPTAGKLLKSVTVAAVDVACTASESDVLNGKTFISGSLVKKTGSASVPTVVQDSSTKALTIS
jgi:hypothetical protein